MDLDSPQAFTQYQDQWRRLLLAAKKIIAFDRDLDLSPVEVISNKEEWIDNQHRTDCEGWYFDEPFIHDRLFIGRDQFSSDLATDAERYITSILERGPECRLCGWNRTIQCVHPKARMTWVIEEDGCLVLTDDEKLVDE